MTQSRPRFSPRAPAPTPTRELPPAAIEMEKAVLGCILLNPEEGMLLCAERKVTPAWFYETAHATIYTVLQELYESGRAPDPVSVCDRLEQEGRLQTIGGYPTLSALMELVPSGVLLGSYLDEIEPKHNLRRLLRMAASLSDSCRQPDADVQAVVSTVSDELLKVIESRGGARVKTPADFSEQLIALAEEYSRPTRPMRGMFATGMSYLDKILDGIGGRNGNFFVLAGRPGAGKTAMAIQLAMYAAELHHKTSGESGAPVAVFSMEMGEIALFERMLFAQARVNLQKFRTGYRKDMDAATLCAAVEPLTKLQIFVDDSARMNIATFKARARQMHRKHGARLFVVDYIQLMRGTPQRNGQVDRVLELEEISGEIVALGKELGCPFIVLAQMNRDYEKDPLRPPRLSDLKNCGAIEQDADVVAFLYQARTDRGEGAFRHFCIQHVYERARGAQELDKDTWLEPIGVNLLVAKARFGPAGKTAALLFHRADLRFTDFYDFMADQNESVKDLEKQWKAWMREQAGKKKSATPDPASDEEIQEWLDKHA